MASFYLGVFMVSLVSRIHHFKRSKKKNHILTRSTGQTHRQHSHPSNHERLQIARRYRMVWYRLPAHQRSVPAAFRKAVQVRSDQGHFLGFHPGFRGGLDCLRCGSELNCIHCRQSDRWCGSWRRAFRRGEFGTQVWCFPFNADVSSSRWLSWCFACRLSSVPGCKAWLVLSLVSPQYSVRLSVVPSLHTQLGGGVSGSTVSIFGESSIVVAIWKC